MIDPGYYLKSAGLTQANEGGQELILHEICALLMPYHRVWLPFYGACITLADTLRQQGHQIVLPGRGCDAVYFGTPTIVDGKPLFPSAPTGGIYNKATERAEVRRIMRQADAIFAKRVVSGLGSGDISVKERKADMGKGARVVVKKVFDGFTDWVIVRDL